MFVVVGRVYAFLGQRRDAVIAELMRILLALIVVQDVRTGIQFYYPITLRGKR